MSFDKVLILKYESTSHGGSQDDLRQTEFNPKEDGFIGKGFDLVHDEENPYTSTLARGVNLDANGNLQLRDTNKTALLRDLDSDETFRLQATAHGFTSLNRPQPVYIDADDSKVKLAKADHADTLPSFYILSVIDADTLLVKQRGFINYASHGYTIGEYYYLSNVTAGDVTIDVPYLFINVVCFYVVDANTLLLIDNRPYDSESIEKFLIKTTNTDTTTNLNELTPTEVPLTGNTPINEGSYYEVVGNGIKILRKRLYNLKANIHAYSDRSRANLTISFYINGTRQGMVAASGYIRAASGHNESSYQLNDAFSLDVDDVVTVRATREANSGDIFLATSGTSNFIIEAK